MKTVFFDPANNLEIVDVSGNKSIEDIKSEFGDHDYQTLSIDDGEGHRIVNGGIEKFDLQTERNSAIAQRELDLAAKRDAIKAAKDFAELKSALLDFYGIE